MAIEIKDEGTIWSLWLNGRLVVACPCEHVCRRFARIMTEASNASHREAMRMMIEDLGFCESLAQTLHLDMFGHSSTVN